MSGSLHISPGKTIKIGGVIAHDVKGLKNKQHNMNHVINHLSFGDEFPGQSNPLDETEVSSAFREVNEFRMLDLFLKKKSPKVELCSKP